MCYFVTVDNNNFKFFGTVQDHKRVFEKDKGLILEEWVLILLLQ